MYGPRKKRKAGKVYTQYNGMVQIIIELLIWMRDHGIRQGGGGGAIQESTTRSLNGNVCELRVVMMR